MTLIQKHKVDALVQDLYRFNAEHLNICSIGLSRFYKVQSTKTRDNYGNYGALHLGTWALRIFYKY